MASSYHYPAQAIEVVNEVKKSRFIASVNPVKSRTDALQAIKEIKNVYPDARHHCWAYLVGNPNAVSSAGMNDDGEPSGTAGKPILNVIQHKKIGDVLVVVTRYFGGIKLGAGGLVRAYSNVAEEALTTVPLATHQVLVKFQLRAGFSQEQSIRHWCKQHHAEVTDVQYQNEVCLTLQVPLLSADELKNFCSANHIKLKSLNGFR